MTLFDSLQSAANACIAHGNIPGNINLAAWAVTYRASESDVEQALKIAENGSRKLPEEAAAAAPPSIEQEEDAE